MATTVTADGVTISYQVHGDDPELVFVHGITDSGALWEPIIERLRPDVGCVVLDLRGHGGSGDANDYSAFAMASDIAAVVQAAGVDSPVLVGHSLGAFVATAAATALRPAGVINVDQPLRMSDFKTGLTPLEPMLTGSEAEFHAALDAVFGALGEGEVDPATRERIATNHATARQDVVLGVWGTVFGASAEELDSLVAGALAAVRCPYLAIHGSEPGAGYRQWLTDAMPQAEIELWEGGGHFPHLSQVERFADRVRTFARPR